MVDLAGIGLIVVGIIGLLLLVWVARTLWAMIGNVVAGAVAFLVAWVVGIQVPITVLTVLTVVITGLPGALILIGATLYDPTVVPSITDRFLRLVTF